MSEEDFRSLLGDDAKDIEPIRIEKRAALDKPRSKSDINQAERKKNAVDFFGGDLSSDPLDSSAVPMLEPMSLLQFQRPGVQHGVYKNMRLGKYRIDATLDLHRMTVEQARSKLYTFIQDCLDNDIRSALITHGKGEGRETPALLKSCVAHWLPQIEAVLAFHTAQKQHGSYGASYVLLKKSDNKKLKNKEVYRK